VAQCPRRASPPDLATGASAGFVVSDCLRRALEPEGDLAFEPIRMLWEDDQTEVHPGYSLLLPRTVVVYKGKDFIPDVPDRLFWVAGAPGDMWNPVVRDTLKSDLERLGIIGLRFFELGGIPVRKVPFRRKPFKVTIVDAASSTPPRQASHREARSHARLEAVREEFGRSRQWSKLEGRGRAACMELAGIDVAASIEGVELGELEEQCVSAFAEVAAATRVLDCKAIYVEWSPHNDWSLAWFACRVFDMHDDTWAGAWTESWQGGSAPGLAAIGRAPDQASEIGREAYLTARILAMLGRAASRAGIEDLHVGASCHNDRIFHLIDCSRG
jgi:hypothetical protein